ncbi:MAG TPA: hypothetical protein ENJ60_15190 [Aeromonadales bacterium]|nr:hypothetical protein [Aeromonadales bacterium]
MSKSSLNLDENIACVLCYAFWWVGGLIILFLEKDNKTIRFQAAQSIIIFGGFYVFQMIFGYSVFIGAGFSIFRLFNLAAMILWIFLMIKSYQKQYIKIPVVSELAETLLKKVNL